MVFGLVIGIAAIAFVIIWVVRMWMEAHRDVVLHHDVHLDNLPEALDGTTFFFISDVHRRVIAEEIITAVDGRASFIVIGGDLTEKGVPFDRVETNVRRLRDLAPVYFVWGNNDYEVDARKLETLLHACGVHILDNSAALLENEGARLVLVGVDDYGTERDRLDLAMDDAPKDGFRLLISHNPDIREKVESNMGISFILSGHTHGGQIRLFGWGPREKGGMKQYPGYTLLISNGYGTTTIPLRFNAPAETHLISLKRNENACLDRA
ncbi:MAG TPA: metallophosphoesterase [Bacillales bacterium]|nr:metallophosphoesterase [Bacillales bacterium]